MGTRNGIWFTDVEEYFIKENRLIMVEKFTTEFVNDLKNNDVEYYLDNIQYYLDNKFATVKELDMISHEMILVTSRVDFYFDADNSLFIHEKDFMWLQIRHGLNI